MGLYKTNAKNIFTTLKVNRNNYSNWT